MHIASKLAAALSLLLCSQAQAFNVFACEPSAAALVSTLLPSANITTATTAWQDPHHIEARPSLIAKLRQADLLICTGASLEAGWLPVLLRRASNPQVQPNQAGHFMMADHVELLDQIEHVDRSMGDVHGEGNPHIWMSPQRLIKISQALSERLIALLPDQQVAISSAKQEFSSAMNSKITEWETLAAPLRGSKVIAYHANLRYFTDWLGIEEIAYLEPKPGSPPTARHLQRLRQIVTEQPVLAIIDSQTYPDKPARQLAETSGVEHIRLVDSVGTDHAETFFDVFDYNIRRLLQ